MKIRPKDIPKTIETTTPNREMEIYIDKKFKNAYEGNRVTLKLYLREINGVKNLTREKEVYTDVLELIDQKENLDLVTPNPKTLYAPKVQ